jgi:hypothetical protein
MSTIIPGTQLTHPSTTIDLGNMSIKISAYSHSLINNSNTDDIDLDISSQTSAHLYIITTPNKLQKIHNNGSTNTYLLLNIFLPTTSSTILDQLLPALIRSSIMEDAISHSIRFTRFPSIYNMDKK